MSAVSVGGQVVQMFKSPRAPRSYFFTPAEEIAGLKQQREDLNQQLEEMQNKNKNNNDEDEQDEDANKLLKLQSEFPFC